MKTEIILAACAAMVLTGWAGAEYPELPLKITDETAEHREARMAWWKDGRFGMFIHFGLYAVPARHEWVQSYEGIAPDEYERRYLKRFNPDLYDYPMGFLPIAFMDKVEYAQFLHDGSELKLVPPATHHDQSGEQKGALGGIRLPMKKPAVEVPVIELWLK